VWDECFGNTSSQTGLNPDIDINPEITLVIGTGLP
jgi:hypothetical protein